ncbi:MAG: T9SS type A sorting domain-containing protein, partial [Bacteroidales bacterium]|nr:T9SS type A sorting domain-containing protein [Bacteroidales bacterium]
SGVAEALNEGIRTGVAVAPLNGDSFPEIIVGNYAGGISYFRGVTPPDHLSAGNNKKNDIIIAPNPNNGTFTIKGDAPLKRIEITDLSGRTLLVKDNIADNEFTVRLGNAANGMYFVKIEGKPIIKAVLGGQ